MLWWSYADDVRDPGCKSVKVQDFWKLVNIEHEAPRDYEVQLR